MNDALMRILQPETGEQKLVRQAKERATLVSRCALLGYVLLICDDDRGRPLFIVTRDALCRAMHSEAEVDAWIKLAGGPSA